MELKTANVTWCEWATNGHGKKRRGWRSGIWEEAWGPSRWRESDASHMDRVLPQQTPSPERAKDNTALQPELERTDQTVMMALFLSPNAWIQQDPATWKRASSFEIFIKNRAKKKCGSPTILFLRLFSLRCKTARMRSFKSIGLAGKRETQPTRYTLALFKALMEFAMSRLENNTEGGKSDVWAHHWGKLPSIHVCAYAYGKQNRK